MEWMARRPLLTSALAGILVGGLIAGVWTLSRPDGDDVSATAQSAKPKPTTPTTVAPAATQAEIDATVDELVAFIADVRGLEALNPVTVELQDEEPFLAGVLEDLDPDNELPGVGLTLEALKLIDPGTDLLAELRNTLGDGVLGYYDPDEDALFVRGTSLTPFLKMTLAHELTHAIQDQHFGLEGFDDLDDEAAVGMQGLVEGDAVSVQNEYLLGLPPAEQLSLAQEAMGFLAGGDVDGDDNLAVLEEVISFPYVAGPSLIEALIDESDEGDYSLVDAAFVEPPLSSEQVLHPDKYLSHDDPLDVEVPEARGETVDSGQLGEFLLGVLLKGAIPEEDALEAAEGWGGDAYSTWREDDHVVFSARFLMDSGKDREELAEAFDAWADEHGTAVVTRESRAVVVEASIDLPA